MHKKKHNYNRSIACLFLVLLLSVGSAAFAESLQQERKYNPGHYVALDMSSDGEDAILSALRPGVRGVQKRYAWRSLEPSRDEYDFSAIAEDLAAVKGAGRQLVVFIFDKSFRNEKFTPEYLWDAHTLPIRSATPGKGFVSKRWDPYVISRMSKLLAEIGRQFDDDLHLEGIAIQESALGVSDLILDREGYTPQLYKDALIQTLRSARAALPKSRIFWYMNYLARGQKLLQPLCSEVMKYDIVLGGPDALPDSTALRRHVYPLLNGCKESMLFIAAQNDSFRHLHAGARIGNRFWTPQEIFEFARDELGVQYLFWNRVTHPNPIDSYGIIDAYPVISENPQINDYSPRNSTVP